jgi:hypothetical protein
MLGSEDGAPISVTLGHTKHVPIAQHVATMPVAAAPTVDALGGVSLPSGNVFAPALVSARIDPAAKPVVAQSAIATHIVHVSRGLVVETLRLIEV